jgi:hypothetical protein
MITSCLSEAVRLDNAAYLIFMHMRISDMSAIDTLVRAQMGERVARQVLAAMEIDAGIAADTGGEITRAGFAMALGVCLFARLLESVPTGAAYVIDRVAAGGRIRFDHGAIRTIRFAKGATGALPAGQDAFRRILEPLGYHQSGTYPLPRLRMTGRAYSHADHAEAIPQYFVSELHVGRFDAHFAEVAARIFGGSRDPLGVAALDFLEAMSRDGRAPLPLATAALPEVLGAFDRQHDVPALSDYEALLAQSAEAAWIATEGNAFNHATDRVDDVVSLADAQRALGRPIKDQVEVSASGRVRQTAYRADLVLRRFRTAGGEVERWVPGSFYEFITRAIDPATGRLDLAFDSGNATGIFGMTKAA